MKYIKFFLINVIIFAIFFLLLSFLFPSVVNTSKTINIAAQQKTIADKVKNIAGWKTWNEFAKSDSITIAVEKVQGDSLIFTKLTNDDKNLSAVFGIVPTQTDSTILNFKIVQTMKWYQPWKKFATLLSESKFGYPMELSLNNFKKEIQADTIIRKGN